MKYKSLLLCLSILVAVFAGCSSQPSAEEVAKLVAEQMQAAEAAKAAEVERQAEHHAAEQALADAEKLKADAERALSAARQQSANTAKQAEAIKKAEADHAKAVEDARIAAEQAKAAEDAQAKAAAEAKAAEERAAARQAKADSRAKAQIVTLAAGTPIKAITSSEISTQTGKTGDRITMTLNEDITDGGRVIAQRGSTVKGVISESDPGGRVKGVAMISVTMNSLTLANGSEVSVKTNDFSQEAASSVGKDATRTGIAAGIGAAIGAIAGGAKGAAIGAGAGAATGTGVALATHGNAAVIAPETVITFNLTVPLTVTLQRESGGGRPPQGKR